MEENSLPDLPEGYNRNVPKLPDSAELSDIADRARRNGFVAITNLSLILAWEDGYTEKLPILWEEFQIGIRRHFPADISSPEIRVGIWYTLFERWTQGTVAAVSGVLGPIKILPGYSEDPRRGKLVAVDGTDKDPDYVMLDELKSYFTEYLEIHPPSMLFLPQDEVQQDKPDKPAVSIMPPYSFIKNGEFWQIRYGDEQKPIKNLDGIYYIAILLERPGTSVSCRDLYRAVSGKTPDKIMSEGAAIDEGLNIGSSKQAVSDHDAKQDYWKLWQKLQDDIDNAEDTPEGEMVKKESQRKQDELARYLEERTIADPNDKKAQANVKKRLNIVFEALGKNGMKKLAKHLRKCIKPDGAFGLSYTGSHAWEIQK